MTGMEQTDKLVSGTQSKHPLCDRQELLNRAGNARTGGDNVHMIVLYLDRYRKIVSALGHEFAHQVHNEIGERILRAYPEAIAFSHLADDEFAVLLASTPKARLRTLSEAALKTTREPLLIDGQTVVVTASAGIASSNVKLPLDGAELLQQAGLVASEGQRKGGNCFTFYSGAVQQEPLRRLDLELDLRRALEADEISVFYQPIFDLRSNRVTGLEALARWRHADLGWIEPTEFIPLAEESGLIADIGVRVLNQACADTRAFLGDTQGLDYVAVNFAARQIEHRDLVKITEGILGRLRFPADRLVLEITESDFLESEQRIIKSLATLRSSGVRVAIDDFGTGYSSLRVLKEFPADVLKIDRQFVQNAHCRHVDATITRAVIDIAHSLDMKVVAEGVENTEQLHYLRAAGCDAIQGFYVGRAVGSEQLAELFNATGIEP